jgi:parallel beta-helix repeat protein
VPDIAQNGIQVGFGAAGRVEGNLAANHVWTGCTAAACSTVAANVLVFEAADGPVVRRNGTANAQVSIYYFGTDGGLVEGNDVTETRLFDGIYVAGDSNQVRSNNVTNSDGAGIFVEGSGNRLSRNRINEAPIGIWDWTGGNTVVTAGGNRNTFVNVGVPVHAGMSAPLSTALNAAGNAGGRRQGSPVR